MILPLVKTRYKQILLDIDTQKDFLLVSGKACVKNHRRVLANIRRIMAWARSKGVLIISTAEVYANHNGESIPGYCLDGTEGQRKVHYTLVNNRISFTADGNTDLPRDIFKKYNHSNVKFL